MPVYKCCTKGDAYAKLLNVSCIYISLNKKKYKKIKKLKKICNAMKMHIRL